MTLQQTEEQDVIKAVKLFVERRFRILTIVDMADMDKDDVDRLKFDKDGYLEIEIKDLEAELSEDEDEDDDGVEYMVEATVYLKVERGEDIEYSTDTYAAYKAHESDKWHVDWHSS